MLNILIFLFLISYLILAKIRLDWAVMLLIAALPSYLIRFNVFGIPFTLLEAMILISFAVWFLKNYKEIFQNSKFKIRHRYPFDVEIILLLIISFIAIAVAGFSDNALGIWKAYFFEPVLVFILILNVFGNRHNIEGDIRECRLQYCSIVEKIFWPLTISAFAVSAFAIYQKFTGHFIFNELWATEETRRVTSFFGYPNAVGLFLGPIVLIMIGWLSLVIARSGTDPAEAGGVERRSNPDASRNNHGIATPLIEGETPASRLQLASRNDKLKLLFIGLTIMLSSLSIYFAKSEGALIGIVAGILLFCLLVGKRVRWATITLIFIAGLGIIMSQPVSDYAVKKITLHDLSGEIRKQQWRETWQMMVISPARFILGTGLANYQNAIESYHQEGIFFDRDNDPEFHRHVVWNEGYKKSHWQPVEVYLYPHNILLNFWTELGLAGMLLFVWIIGKYVYMGIRNLKLEIRNLDLKNKYLTLGLVCAMVVIVVHGIVDVPYFKNDLAVMFWVLIAMLGLVNLKKLPQINK